MNKKKVFGLLGLGALIAFINLLLGSLFIKFVWSDIAQRLFPKLVESGQIDPTISFLNAFFIGVYLFVIIRALSGKMITMDKKGNFKGNRMDKEIEKDIENKEDK